MKDQYSFRSRIASLSGLSVLIVLCAAGGASAQCQDVCLYTNGLGQTVPCMSNAQCTGGPGDYCNANAGGGPCCDQAEEDNYPNGACKCGDTISGGVTLRRSLNCASGTALSMNSGSGILNLDGNAITCTGSCSVGVSLGANNNTVRGSLANGGRISGFTIGVNGSTSNTGTTAGPYLTVEDGGKSVQFGISNVANVTKSIVAGAAVSFAGNAINLGSNCSVIDDNIVTDSIRGIACATCNANCKIIHNRAIGNDYGFAFSSTAVLDDAASKNNIMLNNSVADLWDAASYQRFTTATNVCRVAQGAYATCTLDGLSYTP